RRPRDAERQNLLRVRVHDRLDVGSRLVDGGVNEPFEIERTTLLPHRLPIEAQLDDVVALDKLGCERAGDEKMPWVVGAAHADMAVSIHHVLVREDAVGHDELLNDGVETAHSLLTPR